MIMRFCVLLIFCLLTFSCKERHNIDILLNEGSTGWCIVIFDQEGEPDLKSDGNSIILDFSKEKIISTRSKPFHGKVILNVSDLRPDKSKNLRKGENVFPFRYVERLVDDKLIKYYEMYIGGQGGFGGGLNEKELNTLVDEYIKNHNQHNSKSKEIQSIKN